MIEVNVQPARTWREAVEITTGLYQDARQTRLGAQKFMIDGRHTGTGAATTSCSAARPRRIRRSCAGRTC